MVKILLNVWLIQPYFADTPNDRNPMTLNDLLTDVLEQLPDDRRKAMEAMTEKFGASDTFRFTLALLAGSDSRERRLIRMLLNEIERLEIE
jgi:hypothetical protein